MRKKNIKPKTKSTKKPKTKTKTKPAKPTAGLAEPTAEQDWAADVVALEKKVTVNESLWNTAKAEAKLCKDRFDEGVVKLRKLINEGPESLPLFDQAKD